MSEPKLTTTDLADIDRRRGAAFDMVCEVCRDPKRNWCMSVPVSPHDSDVIISTALEDEKRLIDSLRAVIAERDTLHAELELTTRDLDAALQRERAATRWLIQAQSERDAALAERDAHRQALDRFLTTVCPTGYGDMKAAEAFEVAIQCVVADRELRVMLLSQEQQRDAALGLLGRAQDLLEAHCPNHQLVEEIAALLPGAPATKERE